MNHIFKFTIVKFFNYISNDNSKSNDFSEKIFYILPYKINDETPNMLLISQEYHARKIGTNIPEIGTGHFQHFRVVSMKND